MSLFCDLAMRAVSRGVLDFSAALAGAGVATGGVRSSTVGVAFWAATGRKKVAARAARTAFF